MGRYIEIPILAAARRCGIRLDDRTLERREVQGYCPFCQGTKNHLFLNTKTNQWYCQKCGRGGNAVTLYAAVFGVDNKTAFRELTQDRLFRFAPRKEKARREPPAALAPLGARHDVYYDMLSMMSLSEKHQQDLLDRGLSPERIRDNMYRSVPAD